MTYDVINLDTAESHGEYETLDEARGAVLYDGLRCYAIWQGYEIVETTGTRCNLDDCITVILGKPKPTTH